MVSKLLLTIGDPPTTFFLLLLPYMYSDSVLGAVIGIFL